MRGIMDRKLHKPALAGAVLAVATIGALAMSELPDSFLLVRVIEEEGNRPLSRGADAPDFELSDESGATTVSLADLKGESSVVVFASFSCPYSRKLMRTVLDGGPPDLGNRLVFIQRGANSGREPTDEEATLQAELATQFPVLNDDDEGSTFHAYQANRVPTTYVLTAEGKVAASGVGEPESAKLVQVLVEDVLKQRGN